MDKQEIVERLPNEIIDCLKRALLEEDKPYPRRSNWASMIGHPCLRYLVYFRAEWQRQKLPDPTLKQIFRDGRIHETDVLKLLRIAEGYIHESGDALDWSFQQTQQPFQWPEYNISGSVDGMILVITDEGLKLRFPTEIKSLSPYTWNAINDFLDLFDKRRPWLVKWAYQLLSYLLMAAEEEYGFYILKNKAPAGAFPYKVIPCVLDYEIGEEICQRAEEIERILPLYEKAETEEAKESLLPPRITPSEEICGRCDFLELCRQERHWGPELVVLTDDELVEKLQRRSELAESASSYKAVDDYVKTAIKNRASISEDGALKEANIIAGDFMCKVKVIAPKGKKPYQKVDICGLDEEEIEES